VTALALSVFTASLLGSVHCAGMCGGLVAVASGGPGGRRAIDSAHVSFSLGRLVAYVVLGAVAGSVGGVVDLAGHLAGIARAAAVLAGIGVIGSGIAMYLDARGVRRPRCPIPRCPAPVLAGALRAMTSSTPPATSSASPDGRRAAAGEKPPAPRPWSRRTPSEHRRRVACAASAGTLVRRLVSSRPARAAGLGVLAACLPCGWLYAFVLTAAATATPLGGVAVMSAFWLGTLPALLLVGAGAGALTGSLRRHVPVACAVAMVVVGLLAVASRTAIIAIPHGAAHEPASAHHADH
jgi:sulfite exporter TauE/SafE